MLGKKVGTNLYIHKEYIGHLLEEYLSFYNDIHLLVNPSLNYNIIKMDIKNQKISFLKYGDFYDSPFPILLDSHSYDVATKKSNIKNFENSKNPPILHRKELLIDSAHPKYENYLSLTKQAKSFGLFKDTKKIGFQKYWNALLKQKGLKFDPENYRFIKQHTVDRHKTALTRYELSVPVRLILKHKMLTTQRSFFDYGCGKGSDVTLLIQDGFQNIDSYDPYYFPDQSKKQADIVNLGYVTNVIEDIDERTYVLRDAYEYSNQLLVVSVMTENSNNTPEATPFKDGLLTKTNTFQKYYTQSEIKHYIDSTLDVYSIPVNQGIFFIFKDEKLQETFLLNKFKNHFIEEIIFENRLPKLRKISHREKRFLRVKNEMTQFWQDTITQGRLLESDEINAELYDILSNEYSSIKRLYKAAFENFEIEEYEESAKVKREDLIVYFALTQFKKPLRFKDYDLSVQRDIKAHLQSHKNALFKGKNELFDIANKQKIILAVAESYHRGLGYVHDNHSYMFHASILDQLPIILRIYVHSATFLYGDIDDVDIIKIHLQSDKLTLLYFNDFEKLLPELQTRVKVNLQTFDVDIFDYSQSKTKQILYLKSYYMHKNGKAYEKQKMFDESLEERELFAFSDRGVSKQEFYSKFNSN